MSEVVVKLTSDRIKIKGGEYVRDLVRCRDCKNYRPDLDPPYERCRHWLNDVEPDDYCSYGEREGE